MVPITYGGGQERQVRSGTIDTVGVLGFSVAAELVGQRLHAEGPGLVALRDAIIEGALGMGTA